jgi:hypothetical protein
MGYHLNLSHSIGVLSPANRNSKPQRPLSGGRVRLDLMILEFRSDHLLELLKFVRGPRQAFP